MTTKLSSAAYAVISAAHAVDWVNRRAIAAALKAAADQITPYSVEDVPGAAFYRNKILVIVAELENND